MQPQQTPEISGQALFFGMGIAVCVVTAVIMAFVRVPTALTLLGTFAVMFLALVGVCLLVVRFLGSDE